MKYWLIIFGFCLLFSTLVKIPAFAESNFTETLEPSRTIPIGANLGRVAEYIYKKIRLTSDVKEKVFYRKDSLSAFHATSELKPATPIKSEQVAARLNEEMRKILPPGRKLFTLLLPPKQTHYTSLCDQFTAAKIVVLDSKDHPNPIVIADDIRIVSQSPEEESKSTGTSIVVLALRPPTIDKVRKVLKDSKNQIHVRCSAESKYE